jgi:heme-degrading monooxygenase HmoA
MIRTVLTMVVREGSQARFEAVWRAAADRIAGHPGNRGQSLARDTREPRRYVITGDWADRAALAAFEGSADRIALSAGLDPLRESAGKSVQELLSVVPGATPEGDLVVTVVAQPEGVGL